jgi:hypothetical protein
MKQALLEKLIVAQLVKEFAMFSVTRTFIVVFTKSLHWTAGAK